MGTRPANIFWSLFPARQTYLKCPDVMAVPTAKHATSLVRCLPFALFGFLLFFVLRLPSRLDECWLLGLHVGRL